MSASYQRNAMPYSADDQNPANLATAELPVITLEPVGSRTYTHERIPGRNIDRFLIGASLVVGGIALAASAFLVSGVAESDKTIAPAPRYAEASTTTSPTTTSTLPVAIIPRGSTPETAVIPRTQAVAESPTTTSTNLGNLPVISRIPAEAQQILTEALALAEAARQRVSPSTTATTQSPTSPAVIPRN